MNSRPRLIVAFASLLTFAMGACAPNATEVISEPAVWQQPAWMAEAIAFQEAGAVRLQSCMDAAGWNIDASAPFIAGIETSIRPLSRWDGNATPTSAVVPGDYLTRSDGIIRVTVSSRLLLLVLVLRH